VRYFIIVNLAQFDLLRAHLHQEGNGVTETDGYWHIPVDNGTTLVGSIRGPLGRLLTSGAPNSAWVSCFRYISCKLCTHVY